MKRNISHGQNRFPKAAVRGITHHADYLIAALALRERFSNRIGALEVLLHKSFTHDGDSWRCIVLAEVSSIHQRDFHRPQPSRRNAQKITQDRPRRSSIHGYEAIPRTAAQ